MNRTTLLRSLVVYAICLPLAVFLGYQLTDPLTYSAFGAIAVVVSVLLFPILMRWHHFLLVAGWNTVMVLFFIKGNPPVWFVMTALSLGVSILQRTMNRHLRFISVPQVTWPLILLAFVVIVTAQLTGGIGVRALGSDVYGGKKYVFLLGGILGYFALTSQRIPPNKAGLYVGAFFLMGLTGLVGDFFIMVSPAFEFVFWLFPPSIYEEGNFELGTTRMFGVVAFSTAVFNYMLARHGIKGIFSLNRPWRLILFCLSVAVGLLGGFRSLVIILGLTFMIQFYLEGLHKSRLMPAMVFSALLAAVVMVAVAPKLPFTFQRAISFLPIELDRVAVADAEGSAEWRKLMWVAVLPQVPKHLLLGKGYALSAQEFTTLRTMREGGEFSFAENWDSAVVGDYHNGPLSVLLPFGIWGAIAFLWFLWAALRVLYANYRNGPPEFRLYNTLILAAFATRVIMFFVVFGSLNSDISIFAGLLGLSVSLNGGVCKPTPAPLPAANKSLDLAIIGPRPRPVTP